MTKAEAEIWCQDYMNQSPGYVACKDVPNVDHERAVEICVLDVLVKCYSLFKYIFYYKWSIKDDIFLLIFAYCLIMFSHF